MLAIETCNRADRRYRFTVNDTDTVGSVSPVPVSVSYHFVLTVCNPKQHKG